MQVARRTVHPTIRLRSLLARVAVAAVAAAAISAGLLAKSAAPAALAQGPPLTVDEIEELISGCLRAAARVNGRPELTVAVVDAEGNSLGVFHSAFVPSDPVERAQRAAAAIAKASTGAYFSSDEQTFSTRSAAFIIQDHFPPGVRFTPGGPLYGVEFSSFVGSDVNSVFNAPGGLPPSFFATSPDYKVPAAAELRVRGDLGGIGIYKSRRRVGGLGVDDGDLRKRVSIPQGVLTPTGCEEDYRLTFRNIETGRDLERIVLAAARDFLAPVKIRANEITVDGIRLPYTKPAKLATGPVPFLSVPADGNYDPAFPLRGADGIPSRFVDVPLTPPPGAAPEAQTFVGEMPIAFPPRDGTDGVLTEADVRRILWQGAQRANVTRAAIRRPIGLKMQCWISVVDTRGEVLGVFRFVEDATLFSYDVAVQKARTAAFFSDEKVAWSCRAVGQFAQGFYPAGQQDEARGPLFQLQDGLTVGLLTGGIPAPGLPVRNGITIFPGGVPLYKNGVLAGAVGVSGDGIDQDDIVADFASRGFGAAGEIRCDNVSGVALKNSLRRTLDRLEGLVPAAPAGTPATLGQVGLCFFHERLRVARRTLDAVRLDVSPSYVKYPRHTGPVTIR